MLDFLELEETVGRFWHRLVGDTGSLPHHPQAAVTLAAMAPTLSVCFRGFGGEPGVRIVPARERAAGHRLNLRQRVGLGEERLAQALRTPDSLQLPARIALFPEAELNRALYVWLAACMAAMPARPLAEADPLRRDLALIDAAQRLVTKVLGAFPGLACIYRRLAEALLAGRRREGLPATEAKVEALIRALLAGETIELAATGWPDKAPPGYLPALGVPLWPLASAAPPARTRRRDEDQPPPAAAKAGDETKAYAASRDETAEEWRERSPFILNRFEKILAMSEMVAVDRPADDSEEHDPEAADELDDMVLSERKGRPASRFRFDLDLPPEAMDETALTGALTYPEWDFRSASYREDHCRVLAAMARQELTPPVQDAATRALVRQVRRRFEALRPLREPQRGQIDGPDLDLDAVVRRQTDLAAGGPGSDRIHLASRPQAYDLAVTTLMDVSLSTDSWFDDLRVLDVEKQALTVFAHGLAACGDRHEILTFTSRRRDWVRIETVKRFDEAMGPAVEARIAALTPGHYTRIGAAIRHAAAGLKARPDRRKLLIVLTDGKPNDIDHYEGRFAMEDTRMAVIEARRAGICVFAVTVDRESRAYIPHLFGRNGHAVVSKLERLPAALPAIYRVLAA
ncbi:VWA domain-containing protein [Bosea sp. (in: a-proteobacteria)]|uniref:VWA domain-containing protein n=1 Tax=Bosea sp. (in: a-proteobacteria) TaxID=1871050 RepID=UPI002625ECE0|nr:VWA domain-containing protein [Bosea sp. (in: a-proteobacteria)]MCO5089998.1 VWA domain-containing protein [Bosea sp. (in: a-proteobacteria)]